MGISPGDILQITIRGQFAGVNTSNVYYYRSNSTVPGVEVYDAIELAFADTVLAPVRAVISSQFTFNQTEIINLTNGLDYYVSSLNLAGAVTGEPLPTQASFTVKLIRSTRLTRNGSKRYAGLVEAGTTGSAINWIAAQRAAVEQGHAANIIDSSAPIEFDLAPVIVGRFPQGNPNAGQLDLAKINPVAGAVCGNRVSSQNSRKLPQIY